MGLTSVAKWADKEKSTLLISVIRATMCFFFSVKAKLQTSWAIRSLPPIVLLDVGSGAANAVVEVTLVELGRVELQRSRGGSARIHRSGHLDYELR